MKKILIIFTLTCAVAMHAQRMDDVAAHSKYIKAVDEYQPAPGQFVNTMPEYETGDTKEKMAAKCTEMLANNERSVITLGGYAGYVTFHFDHSIANVKGQPDVLILGNCSYDGNSEPGIIQVSKDVNHNGLPDDTWYELKGSADEDSIGKVVYGYAITYSRPATEEPDGIQNPMSRQITITNYIPWTDNMGGSGYMHKHHYYDHTYYPMWISEDQLTFSPSTLLPPNSHNTLAYPQEYWIRNSLAWGYVDNKNNANTEACSFDFGHAVQIVSREPVDIDFVDFIRIYTGVNQFCGWIGETSTEVSGAEDLHVETSIQRIKDALSGIRSVTSSDEAETACFDLQGRKTTSPSRGLYIRNGKKYIIK